MGVTAKVIMEVELENESVALEILNKARNDDFEEINLCGITEGKNVECFDLTVKEIVTTDNDGIQVEIYKTKEISYQLVKSSKTSIENKDIVVIEGIPHIIILHEAGVNLYSVEHSKFYFGYNLQSIQEMMFKLEEKNVIYEIYHY